MSDPLQNIPQEIRNEIAALVSLGKKIDAIKRYREVTGCDLRTGRDAIDASFEAVKYSSPPPLPSYSNSAPPLPSYSNGDSNIFGKKMTETKHDTDGPLSGIPQHLRYEITGLLYSGNKIDAIKRYREAAGCDLKTAKATVESCIMEMKETSPGRLPEFQDGSGTLLHRYWKSIVILFIVLIAIDFIPGQAWNDWLAKLGNLTKTLTDEMTDTPAEAPAPGRLVAKPAPAERPAVPQPRKEPEVQPESVTPYEPVAPGNPDTDLTTLYRRKLGNPDYVAWKNQPGLPKGYQDFIEEHHIKFKRAEIAGHLTLPHGMEALNIPVIPDGAITLDGAIQEQEWARAARIKLDPESAGSTLYLQADENWLYLAADVPGDTTQNGYDQFRFYIHVDIDPAIRNERIHVGRSKYETLGGIRETRIEWQGAPPENDDERWKKYPISDWRIYRLASGASTVAPHRQFEARLNLKESGLAIGSPFPAFVEIETDPVEEGKSRSRRYLGGLGSQDDPAWMVMPPPATGKNHPDIRR